MKTKDDNKVFIKTNISVFTFQRSLEGEGRNISFYENFFVIFGFP